ncbi:MAG: hypothetical protein ACLVCW_04995 [Campylobacter sp.]
MKCAPRNLTHDRGARYVNFIKSEILIRNTRELNFNPRRKSILAIKIPSRQNSSRTALSRKFNLAVRRKIKPIGADYTLPRAGILFGKDYLPRH